MDLDAHARVLCGNVDRGAYEFGIGDYDCDYRVSIMDAVAFPDCLVGPDANCDATECESFDFDGDRDVDLRDLADFELLLKGFSPPPRITPNSTP